MGFAHLPIRACQTQTRGSIDETFGAHHDVQFEPGGAGRSGWRCSDATAVAVPDPDAERAGVRRHADVAADLCDAAEGMRRELGSNLGNLGLPAWNLNARKHVEIVDPAVPVSPQARPDSAFNERRD